ncbi:MAG: hypothetical protein LBB23_00920 [Rickettsiales bacterium]|nr:hypothetical protein [Rickettsiales bacterium]
MEQNIVSLQTDIKDVVAKTAAGFPMIAGEKDMDYGSGFVIRNESGVDTICVNEKFYEALPGSIKTDIGEDKTQDIIFENKNWIGRALPRVQTEFREKYDININIVGIMVMGSNLEQPYYTIVEGDAKLSNAGPAAVYKSRVILDNGSKCVESAFLFLDRFASASKRAEIAANFSWRAVFERADFRRAYLASLDKCAQAILTR